MTWLKDKNNKILTTLLGGVLLITLAYSFYFKIVPLTDADAYDAIAVHLLNGQGYIEEVGADIKTDSAIGRVGPGYQFFLFIIYKIFGHHFEVVWVIQAFLHVLTGGIIYLISKSVFTEKKEITGLVSASLYVLFVDVMQMSGMIMTESLFLFLSILSVYYFVRFYFVPGWRFALAFGIASALCILTRPTALLLYLVFLTFVLSKKYFKEALIVTACLICIIGPWTLRNYLTFDRFILTTAAGGYDLWVGNNAMANGELDPSIEVTSYLDRYGVESADEEGLKRVKEFALTSPLQFIALQLKKTSIYFSVARPSAFWPYLSGTGMMAVAFFSSLFALVIFVCGFAGIWLLFKKGGKIYRWLIALLLTAPLAVIPIVVETRYRFPIYALMSLFAGYFAVTLYNDYKSGERTLYGPKMKVLAFSALIVVGNTMFDFFTHFDIVKDKLGL